MQTWLDHQVVMPTALPVFFAWRLPAGTVTVAFAVPTRDGCFLAHRRALSPRQIQMNPSARQTFFSSAYPGKYGSETDGSP
ncbi:hypothetical protein BN2476_670145 [Paraburkholderia piptadeniae]|uniref:Uncharacterized protein n=1 Tax=Paraburkholderia piptadeniae TaxID=1701573 RepID=A0A1N7SNY3_9BURK|nr:hypothetical protein BN2476_670145 [Paraburkholderia piptadeniae]